jgi:hypothetical protein
VAGTQRAVCTLTYPKHWFDPEDWLTFIEMDGFRDDWHDLSLTDDDLELLQVMIMTAPKQAPAIPQTGGLRKIRFAPPRSSKGKRGGVRVLYAYFQEFGIALLAAAYGKSEQDNIPAGHRKLYRDLLARQRIVFASRTVR